MEVRILVCGVTAAYKIRLMGAREVSANYVYTLKYRDYILWFRCKTNLCFPNPEWKKIHLIVEADNIYDLGYYILSELDKRVIPSIES